MLGQLPFQVAIYVPRVDEEQVARGHIHLCAVPQDKFGIHSVGAGSLYDGLVGARFDVHTDERRALSGRLDEAE